MFIDDLSLLNGHDIPFPEGQLVIHPPRMKDISYITEKMYFSGIDMLNFTKNKLGESDRTSLANQYDFDIFMSIMIEGKSRPEIQERITAAMLMLEIFFPGYDISLQPNAIVLQKDNETPKTINKFNFSEFQQIMREICVLNKTNIDNPNYNPGGPKARELAEKFAQRRAKLNNGKEEKMSIYSRYCSILAVALQLPLADIMEYTVYQIDDQIERLQLRENWQAYFSAKVAGATGMDEAENWMKDIHS